jgi:Ca2+-binding RTX toxin-like protein
LPGVGTNPSAVEVTFTGDEAGTFDDGTNSGTFSEIERLSTSYGADRIDAGAATSGTDIASSGGADSVTDGAGADTIDAGSGDDTVAGGAGDDVITGGDGADTFAFSDGDGADIISDFDIADDDGDGFTNDQFDLSGLTDSSGNPVDIWDVVVSDTVGDGSGDAILTFPNGESLTLTGIDPAGLDAAMMTSMGIPCLAAGTLIDTPDGGRLVEHLRPGDRVLTK